MSSAYRICLSYSRTCCLESAKYKPKFIMSWAIPVFEVSVISASVETNVSTLSRAVVKANQERASYTVYFVFHCSRSECMNKPSVVNFPMSVL